MLDCIIITIELKKPCYKKGSRRPEDSDVPLFTDKELNKLLADKEYKDLAWNNYFEDIGEGRTYQGHWIKPKEEIDEHDKKRKTGKAPGEGAADSAKANKRDFRGFGTIKFPDGSMYQG